MTNKKQMHILIVKDKKFKVEIVNNVLKIDGIFAHDNETQENDLEKVYQHISEKTGLSKAYVFKCFLKAFLKYKRSNKYKNFTECLSASFASDGFNES